MNIGTTLFPIIAQAAAATDIISDIILWVVLGTVMGFIARAILPGEQKMGLILTAIIGAVGAFLGGLVAWKVLNIDVSNLFSVQSILAAVLGSLVVLIGWCLIFKRNWK